MSDKPTSRKKAIPTKLTVCTAIANGTHLKNICHKLRRLVLAETVVWSDWTEGKVGPGKKVVFVFVLKFDKYYFFQTCRHKREHCRKLCCAQKKLYTVFLNNIKNKSFSLKNVFLPNLKTDLRA